MRARIKGSNDVIDVWFDDINKIYRDNRHNTYNKEELVFIDIDWEERTFQLARDCYLDTYDIDRAINNAKRFIAEYKKSYRTFNSNTKSPI